MNKKKEIKRIINKINDVHFILNQENEIKDNEIIMVNTLLERALDNVIAVNQIIERGGF